MKKIFLSFIFSGILALGAQAQGLYVGAGFGYGFRAGSTVVGSDANADGSTEVVRASYGKGMTPNVSVGCLFNNEGGPGIGLELNLGYLIGTKTKEMDEFGVNRGETEHSARSFYLNPSFVVRANDSWKVVPYTKMGIFLGFANRGKDFTHVDQYAPFTGELTGTDDTELEYKGKVATGLNSAIGLDFMLSEKFAIFGEFTARLASWAPGSYTSTNTSVDYTGGVAEPEVVTSVSGNFVRETPANYTGTDAPLIVLPFSAIGFNAGVKLYLSK